MGKHRSRGERRYQNRRHIRRARRIEHHVHHGPRRRNCDCAGFVGRYRKSKAFSCRCIAKKRGAPKLAGSLHQSEYTYRTTVRRRIWNRRLARAWHNAVEGGAAYDNELPSGPVIGRRRHTRTW
jgi:hypothetical protein